MASYMSNIFCNVYTNIDCETEQVYIDAKCKIIIREEALARKL